MVVNLADDIVEPCSSRCPHRGTDPGKALVGIEVPNKESAEVYFKRTFGVIGFQEAKKLSIAVGKDLAGKIVVADIAKMPHLLIAGATDPVKSVCVNTIIMSLIYKSFAGRCQADHDRSKSRGTECLQWDPASVYPGCHRSEKRRPVL